jgi:hypothetical protein
MLVAAVISTVSLVGMSIATNAQQQPQQDKKQQTKQKKEQPQRAQKQQTKQQKEQPRVQQQQQPQAQNKPQQQRAQQQQQVNRPSQQGQRVQPAEHRGAWQQHRARSWQAEHHTWKQRGGYDGYRIPKDHFRGNFGPHHAFRIYRYPMIVVGGYPRFQYDGFWFSAVDPWPEYWSDGWYENDDVYIDYYRDGYYLYNRRHPRDRIAVTIYIR